MVFYAEFDLGQIEFDFDNLTRLSNDVLTVEKSIENKLPFYSTTIKTNEETPRVIAERITRKLAVNSYEIAEKVYNDSGALIRNRKITTTKDGNKYESVVH